MSLGGKYAFSADIDPVIWLNLQTRSLKKALDTAWLTYTNDH
jgi:hypothetical protein